MREPTAGQTSSTGPILVHATAIALEGRAALIVGPSGSGKSDLALRAITTTFFDGRVALQARLLADDQVSIANHDGRLVARPPATIAGRLEVRGLGIYAFDHVECADVVLVADVAPGPPIPRFPNAGATACYKLLGCEIAFIRLDAREASAVAKLLLALARGPEPAAQSVRP